MALIVGVWFMGSLLDSETRGEERGGIQTGSPVQSSKDGQGARFDVRLIQMYTSPMAWLYSQLHPTSDSNNQKET